jgi:UDP-N-acetylmuramoyl-tripeptide--D-alanyl-D-alanine ligase
VADEPEISLTAGQIAEAVGGRLMSGNPDQPIGGFSIDTRTMSPGDLFFAIRGERFDGSIFVWAALARGATGVVVTNPEPEVDFAIVILVDDTTRALQRLARHVRKLSAARVVAITGSAGKTTTKEALADFLSIKYRVFRNKGNFNNHIGLPLSLLELRRRPEIAVVELGMSHAGEISTLVRIAEPEARVWTNVAEVHTEFFRSLDDVADAKAEVLEEAAADTLLVANADDPLVMARVSRFGGRLVTFGLESAADVRADGIKDLGLDGMEATIRTPTGDSRIRIPLLGRGNLANVLAAIAVALDFSISLDEIVSRAASLTPPARRGTVTRVAAGFTIVDDSYNSNPRALARALEVIGQETRCARRIAVIGEMLELGADSIRLHEQGGRLAAAIGLDWLITVGGEPSRALGSAAVAAGMDRDAVIHLPTSAEASEVVRKLVRPGDLGLVKGSRGMSTEIVVDELASEFA